MLFFWKNKKYKSNKNLHIRKNSERSCDTEDWSNDAGIIIEVNYILKYNCHLNFFNITVLLFFLIK